MIDNNEIDLDYILAPENQLETIALARALCPFAESASDAVMLICVGMVEAKGDMCAVSSYLGLEKTRVRGHYQSHLASRIVRELAKHRLTGEGYLVAVSNLIDVAGSQSQTGTARNNASKTLIELCDAEVEKNAGRGSSGKDLNEMTLQELEDMVSGIKSDLKAIAPPTPSQTPVDTKKLTSS